MEISVHASISLAFTKCLIYARENFEEYPPVSLSRGEESSANFAFLRFMGPSGVKATAWRARRVGITQSNMSAPRAIIFKSCGGVPTPITYLGLSNGSPEAEASTCSSICGSGSPTLTPPIAYPGKSELRQAFGAALPDVVVAAALNYAKRQNSSLREPEAQIFVLAPLCPS